jgi:hypothetical protein
METRRPKFGGTTTAQRSRARAEAQRAKVGATTQRKALDPTFWDTALGRSFKQQLGTLDFKKVLPKYTKAGMAIAKSGLKAARRAKGLSPAGMAIEAMSDPKFQAKIYKKPAGRTASGSASQFRAGGPAETKRFTAKKRTTKKPPYR